MRKLILPAPLFWWTFAIFLFLGNSFAQGQSDTCVSPINDVNYTRYTIAEASVYTETNAGPALPNTTNNYAFIATVGLETNYTATSAQLIIPDGTPQPMRDQNLSQRNFSVEVISNSFAAITNSFLPGTYQFIVSNSVTVLNFPGGANLPNPPTLSDYEGAQNIDPTKDYTLFWNPFTNGTTKDLIDVNLGTEFGSLTAPAYGCPGQLTGKSTSFLIPANTLSSNSTYHVNVTFIKVLTVDTNSTPFVALLAGTETETVIRIATLGAYSASGPTVANVAELPNGAVRFDVSVIPSTNYVIQTAPSLSSPTWTTVLTTNAEGSLISFTNKPAGNQLFYRVLPQ